jgi:DNA-binding HxlR family transcriptional regulator
LTGQVAHPDEEQRVRAHRHDPAVLALIRRPYMAELLASLDAPPQTLTELRRRTGARRRYLVDGLRALAAHHAITRTSRAGSWDEHADPLAVYQLTPTGHALVEDLFNLEVWLAAYDPSIPSGVKGL